MAFVSDEKKLIFIHVPKNAGTSVCEHLSKEHGANLTGSRDFKTNGVGNNIEKRFRPNGINVHDSLDEVVEKYPACEDYFSFAIVRNPWARIYSFYLHKLRRGDKDLIRGLSFADQFKKSNALLIQPQFYWTYGIDRLLRYEHIEEDYGKICKDFGFKTALPHLNQSQIPENYKEAYDEYSKKIVAEFYRYEIERLGYRF